MARQIDILITQTELTKKQLESAVIETFIRLFKKNIKTRRIDVICSGLKATNLVWDDEMKSLLRKSEKLPCHMDYIISTPAEIEEVIKSLNNQTIDNIFTIKLNGDEVRLVKK